VIVRVLGSAAGGGVPQWNCACVNCAAARDGRAPRRTQSGLAISLDGRPPWLLLNCSPDIAMQIEAFPALHPRHGRSTPIDGVLLTDANFDHIGGLNALRQAGPESRLRIRSSAAVKRIAAAQASFAHFAAPPHRWLDVPLGDFCANDGDDDLIGDRFSVRAFSVPGSTPGYDGRRTLPGAVVAYEITERASDSRLLLAPVFSEIDETLIAAVERSKVAFLDGSFYSDDELEATARVPKSARSMGHLPVSGPDGTLARFRDLPARLVFTHVNNSNPMLDPGSEATARVREFGAEIAYDGMEVTL
jgi:pyrroloquinoline quinone biosynthesis protein B